MTPRAKTYIFSHQDGTESEPLPQEQLQDLARQGTLRRDTPLRSSLVRNWRPAEEFPFLADCFAEIETVANAAAADDVPKVGPMSGRRSHRLGDRDFAFTSGSVGLRVSAGLTDLLIAAVLGAILLPVVSVARLAGCSPSWVYAAFLAAWYALVLLYLAAGIGFFAQTAGQWFWGLMVVRTDGRPVLLDRAFLLALATVWLGCLMPFFVVALPSGRSLCDLLCDTRVVRNRIIHGT